LKASRRTLEKALQTLDSLDRQVQVAVDAGIATRNDLLKVQLRRNQYRADMVDLDNGIELFGSLLGQYIGLPENVRPAIDAAVPSALPSIPDSLFIHPAEALPQTVGYRLLSENIEAKKLEKRIEVGKNLPSVAVGAGWFYHDVLGQNHDFGAVMVSVNVPLSGWWGGSHAIRRKQLAVEMAQGAGCCFLEVRPSNAPAIALYQGLGFAAVGRRPGFYRSENKGATTPWTKRK
jgi:outer membrane protein TolC